MKIPRRDFFQRATLGGAFASDVLRGGPRLPAGEVRCGDRARLRRGVRLIL